MTVSTQKAQPTSSLHELRDALEKAERNLVRLDRTNIEKFLVQLDEIEAMWTGYDDPSAMRSEDGRWQSILNRINTRPQLITDAASQAGGLAKLRAQHPPATGLWWHVDERISGQRTQSVRKFGIIAGLVVVALLAFWLINSFMSGDSGTAGVVNTGNASQQIDQLVEAKDWQAALTVVETARESAPDDVNLLVWDAVLAEQLGDDSRAETSLTQAQAAFQESPAEFWTLVGNMRLQADNWDGAEEAAQQALALTPQDPTVTLLLANIAEARGDIPQAAEYLNQTIELAGDSNAELAAVARIRLGNLMQSAVPLPGTTFEPSSAVTPNTN